MGKLDTVISTDSIYLDNVDSSKIFQQFIKYKRRPQWPSG